MWFHWGSLTYYKITSIGYDDPANTSKSNYAHFPLYPLLVKIISKITGSIALTGLLISNMLLYFSSLLFFRLLKKKFKEKTCKKSIIYLMIFPSTIFFSVFMSESLFIFLVIIGFTYLQKGNYFLAGITGFLLTATRIVGIGFFLAMIVHYYHNKNRKKYSYLWAFLVPGGLISYMIYLQIKLGNPLIFLISQQEWGRKINILSKEYFLGLINMFTDFSIGNLINISMLILAIISIIWCWKKWDKSIASYSLIAIAMPVMTASLLSINRLVLVVLPIYVMMAKLTEKNKELHSLILVVSSTLMSLWVVLIVNWYWIA